MEGYFRYLDADMNDYFIGKPTTPDFTPDLKRIDYLIDRPPTPDFTPDLETNIDSEFVFENGYDTSYTNLKKDNLTLDELLNIASEVKIKPNTIINFRNSIYGKIVIKFFERNPYPSGILDICKIIEELTIGANIDYFDIIYLFFHTVPKNIDTDRFIAEFDELVSNNIFISKYHIDSRTLEECFFRIKSPIIYGYLFQVICAHDKIFSSTKSNYHTLINNFYERDTSVEYASIMLKCCDPSDLLEYLVYPIDRDFHKIFCFSSVSDTDLKKTFQYLVDNGVELHKSKKLSTFLLNICYERNQNGAFDYLLSVGCRPETHAEINADSINIMRNHCLEIDEIISIVNSKSKKIDW